MTTANYKEKPGGSTQRLASNHRYRFSSYLLLALYGNIYSELKVSVKQSLPVRIMLRLVGRVRPQLNKISPSCGRAKRDEDREGECSFYSIA